MSLETFLVIAFIGVLVYFYFRGKSPKNQIKWLEEKAYWMYGMSLEKHGESSLIYDITDDDEKRLKETENKYTRLKERYKFEPKMLYKIAVDWRDYNLNMYGKVSAWRQYGVNLEENVMEKYDEDIKEHQPIIEEIEKRFDSLLKDK